MADEPQATETASSQPELKYGKLTSFMTACQMGMVRLLNGLAGFFQMTEDELEDAGIVKTNERYK